MRKQKSDSQAKENKRTNAINKDGGDDKTQYCQRHKDACGGIQTEKNKQKKVSGMDFSGHTRHLNMSRPLRVKVKASLTWRGQL